jgi:hypothetical protein
MRGGALAVVIGSALGVTAAIAVRQSADPNLGAQRSAAHGIASSPSARASPDLAVEPRLPPAAPVVAEGVPSTSAQEVSSAALPAANASAVAVPSGAFPSAATATAPSIPDVPSLAPVTTAKQLEQAEIRCYERRPDECDRAADGYEAGTLLPRDQARATKLRKVAFNYRVRACENRSPHACLVLSVRYETGNGVERDSHKAKLLLEHARELCARKPNVECASGEPR